MNREYDWKRPQDCLKCGEPFPTSELFFYIGYNEVVNHGPFCRPCLKKDINSNVEVLRDNTMVRVCSCGYKDDNRLIKCPDCGTIHNEKQYIELLEVQHKMGLNRD